MKNKTPFYLCFLFTLLALPALADDSQESANAVDAAIAAGFSELERQIIETYYEDSTDDQVGKKMKDKEGSSKKMPPGLARKESLPPGLERQLEQNGTLPPGLAKRDLPTDLEQRLPNLDSTLERTIVDSSVVLVEKATGRIVDIIADVVTNRRTYE